MSFWGKVQTVAAVVLALTTPAAAPCGSDGPRALAQDAPPPGTREPGATVKSDGTSQNVVGWRGNWTGLYPEAKPPLEFHRTPRGVTAGMTCQAERPADKAKKSGTPLSKGLPIQWLALGPLPSKDGDADLDAEQIPGEARLAPTEGDKLGPMEWRRVEIRISQGGGVANAHVEYDWCHLAKDAGPGQIVYGHTYLWSEKDGKAEVVTEHVPGLKVWANGRPCYSERNSRMGFGNQYGFSRAKVGLTNPSAPSFVMELRKGWNNILLKMSSGHRGERQAFRFVWRIADSPREYDEKNILWVTPMPERTNASPIVVGDKVFTVSEPDEILCVDKGTGRILWRRTSSHFDAIPEREKKENPRLAALAPVAEELLATRDISRAYELRKRIHDELVKLDKKRFDIPWDGHMSSHFGIVGFSTQPVSDGTSVCVFVGNGVAACYDLDGNRRWIRRLPMGLYVYTSSPAIVGSRFIVNCPIQATGDGEPHSNVRNAIIAFDIETGEQRWINTDAEGGFASLIPATIRGVEVVVTQKGDVLRADDGRLLWSNPDKPSWGPPTVIGDGVYLSCGAFHLVAYDFSGVSGEDWEPRRSRIDGLAQNRMPDGRWVDRPTAAAPLIHHGIAYCHDIFGILYAVDLTEKKILYRQQLDGEPFDSYCHLGASSSPTLGGGFIYIFDNQGVCSVIEPGPRFNLVARNMIATQPSRDRWGIPMREVLTNGSPVFDGTCIYVRGQENLYCIGVK